MDIGRAGRIALGVGAGIGAAALLAACATQEQDAPKLEREPQPAPPRDPVRNAGPTRPARQESAASYVRDRFEVFDRNDKGGISRTETTFARRDGAIHGETQLVRRDARFNYWKQAVGHRLATYSMQDAFRAAKGLGTKDQVASWAELTKLAARLDTDGRPGLSKTEQAAFQRRFGAELVGTKRVWTGEETWRTERYPDPPDHGGTTSPGDDGGHTSPGDDGGRPGNGSTTSPGDDGPSHGGTTSPGDDGPAWPGNGGNGNSSDNGNPSEDDF